MGIISGSPRVPGSNARDRRAAARLSSVDANIAKFTGTYIANVYTDLTGVGTHGEIALYKPAGNPFLVLHYNGTWYDAAGGAVS